MNLRDDPRYFPQPDVPNNGNYGGNFGREQLYYDYSPRSAAVDTAGEKTYSSGKYTFDPATGQYTWVPAGAVASNLGGNAGAGINAGGQGSGESGKDYGGKGDGGGLPGTTTGMASAKNAAAAGIGNLGNRLGGVFGAGLRGMSDEMAKNVDPNYSHEGRSGRGSSAEQDAKTAEQAATADAMSNAISGADTGGFTGADSNAGGFGPNTSGEMASGGLTAFAHGGLGSLGNYSDGGRLLRGPGDVVSDSIPATIGKAKQPARLADGEFVVPARIVSELGNGSTAAGARKLYAMLARIQAGRKKSIGRNNVATNSRMDKHLPA